MTPVFAQPIVSDGTTKTVVTPNGARIDISGGTLSGDGGTCSTAFKNLVSTRARRLTFSLTQLFATSWGGLQAETLP